MFKNNHKAVGCFEDIDIEVTSMAMVKEYTITEYFGFPRRTQSIIVYKIFTEHFFWDHGFKFHCWNVVYMPKRTENP